MTHFLKGFLFSILFSALATEGSPQSGLPKSSTTWQCMVRCYRQSASGSTEWLGEKNHTVTACAKVPADLHSSLDQYCEAAFPEAAQGGWIVKGYLNWPATPGSLVACKNTGTKCAEHRFLPTIWECPASCSSGSRMTPVFFSLCATSQHFAWRGGLELFKSDGPNAICKPGYVLGDPESSKPFGDPPTSLCKNTQKECEIQ